MRLAGQRAIVTGGASGIGAAITRAFAREGARVVAVDMNEAPGQALVADIRREGGQAQFLPGDVSDPTSVSAFVEEAVGWLGGLSTVVNNAGVGTPGKVLETREADWARMLAVNLTGVFLVCKATLPHLLDRGGGCIINMASVAGLVGIRERAGYCASKGGVIALTRAIAVDYVAQGVRCNAICPGTVDTPWVERMVSNYPDPAATRAAMVARQPMGRLGKPEEIAQAAVYLASEDAAFITGTCFVIDGGLTMQ